MWPVMIVVVFIFIRYFLGVKKANGNSAHWVKITDIKTHRVEAALIHLKR